MDTKYRQYSETLTTTTTADFFQHLPHGIVSDHIFDRLDFISRVRARCVCPSWRDLFHLPPHPWLCTSPASSSRISLQELPMAYLCKDMEVAGSYDHDRIPCSLGRSHHLQPFHPRKFQLPMTTKSLSDGREDPILLPLRLARISCRRTSFNG